MPRPNEACGCLPQGSAPTARSAGPELVFPGADAQVYNSLDLTIPKATHHWHLLCVRHFIINATSLKIPTTPDDNQRLCKTDGYAYLKDKEAKLREAK